MYRVSRYSHQNRSNSSMELLPCLIYTWVVFELSRTASSVQFTTVTLSNGTQICANGVQISPSATRVLSVLQCAQQFVRGSTPCNFFSYNRKFQRCSLLSGNPFRNYTIDTNCRSFQIKKPLPQDCLDIVNHGYTTNGVYTIYINGSVMMPVSVHCDMSTTQGGWLVLQRRLDGSVDFYRNWNDYTVGFGNVSKEFWLGNENLHLLTTSTCRVYTLRFDLTDLNGVSKYAEYANFRVDSSSNFYRITFTTYTGNAGDAMGCSTFGSNGQYFTTLDVDHDTDPGNCALQSSAGWWYSNCHNANPNGLYGATTYGYGINWNPWHGYQYSLKFTEIKIRPAF